MEQASITDRYQLVDELSSGGMGTVWRGYDDVLDREVAVKLIRPDVLLTPGLAPEAMDELLGEFDIGIVARSNADSPTDRSRGTAGETSRPGDETSPGRDRRPGQPERRRRATAPAGCELAAVHPSMDRAVRCCRAQTTKPPA